MTIEGAERLKAELDRLRDASGRRAIEVIAEAVPHGDLSRNA